VDSGDIIRFGVFYADGYTLTPGDEGLSVVEAEEAAQFGLLRENDSLSAERAKELAADWIRDARSLRLVTRLTAVSAITLGAIHSSGRCLRAATE
jgi:hypothetical protein